MRADIYLFERGYAKSREAAKKLISAGSVTLDGIILSKPSQDIDGEREHSVTVMQSEKYVSRGGLKLEGALDTFGISVEGLSAADIGASTGGFTDCLLSRGAARVWAADAGHGQLDRRIEGDCRVTSIEGFNARRLCDGECGGIPRVHIAVMDVSFISQTLIIPGLPNILSEGGIFISLIKPQFEAGRAAVGKGGIVRSESDRAAAVERVILSAAASGFDCLGLCLSPIEGGDGNVEYLAHFRLEGGKIAPDMSDITKVIKGGLPWKA